MAQVSCWQRTYLHSNSNGHHLPNGPKKIALISKLNVLVLFAESYRLCYLEVRMLMGILIEFLFKRIIIEFNFNMFVLSVVDH